MKDRIYVCHTFYHVYVACLKEFYFHDGKEAALVLSKMSTQFGGLVERARKSPIFSEVYEFDEKRDTFFPQLEKVRKDTGNLVVNMLHRISFCKQFGKLQEAFVPVDFSKYGEIYVFADEDPIGYYLDYKKLKYHALEDGLDCIKYYDTARYDNRGHFGIKAWMASLGLIHMQNGYGRYCIDMEVNNISILDWPCKKYVELPRKQLTDRLTQAEKELLLELFVDDVQAIREKARTDRKKLLVLSEPLCDLETRVRIFQDIIRDYSTIGGEKAVVIIKQHPRDLLDYRSAFPDTLLLDGSFPMEMLNLMDGVRFDRVVSVFTVTDSIQCAEEKIFLGEDFMDKYEDPAIHRQNEAIY